MVNKTAINYIFSASGNGGRGVADDAALASVPTNA